MIHDEDWLEQLYWEFDRLRKSGEERLRFKGFLRAYGTKCVREAMDTVVAAQTYHDKAQPQQEPVAWSYWQSCLNDDGTQTAPWVHRFSKFQPSESIINKDIMPLYTSPPASKPWVGLTYDEFEQILDKADEGQEFSEYAVAIYQLIQAKFREKNT